MLQFKQTVKFIHKGLSKSTLLKCSQEMLGSRLFLLAEALLTFIRVTTGNLYASSKADRVASSENPLLHRLWEYDPLVSCNYRFISSESTRTISR